MKTLNQKNPLAFHKNALVELNNQELRTTDSGITPSLLASSAGCALVGFAIIDASAGFINDVADGWNDYGG